MRSKLTTLAIILLAAATLGTPSALASQSAGAGAGKAPQHLVMINPQPLPPGELVAINPQPLPPGE